MPAELAPGVLVDGRYHVDRLLGRGGMGAVWAATHAETQEAVALKVLAEHDADNPRMRRRLLREAQMTSALKHPNIVTVREVIEPDEGAPVMVMDLLEGEPLDYKLLRGGRLSLDEAAAILVPVVSAVGTAHALGMVHRDLKPANIFLAQQGDRTIPKVLDFGIAKFTGADRLVRETGGGLTSTGAMLGTPFYMAPEQCAGEKDIDHRVDIWALGIILYECLCGRRPITADNLGQVIKRILIDGVPPLAEVVPDLPGDVYALVDCMLARDRAQRPADLREVQHVLEKYASSGAEAPSFGPPPARAQIDSSPTGGDSSAKRTPAANLLAKVGEHSADLAAARAVPTSGHLRSRHGLLAVVTLAMVLGALVSFRVTRANRASGAGTAPHGGVATAPEAPTGSVPPAAPPATASPVAIAPEAPALAASSSASASSASGAAAAAPSPQVVKSRPPAASAKADPEPPPRSPPAGNAPPAPPASSPPRAGVVEKNAPF